MKRARIAERKPTPCAYCGVPVGRKEEDHVIPHCLYRASPTGTQLIKVPACGPCNGSFSDDEAHFRNVLLLAGEANEPRQELWETKALRSFDQPDGYRRLRDLIGLTVPVIVDGRERLKIFPARDERVIRVLRKIVRGLSHFHGLESAVTESRVWADVVKHPMPDSLVESTPLYHCDPRVFQYWFMTFDGGDQSSFWFLRFFERVPFIAAVAREPLFGSHAAIDPIKQPS